MTVEISCFQPPHVCLGKCSRCLMIICCSWNMTPLQSLLPLVCITYGQRRQLLFNLQLDVLCGAKVCVGNPGFVTVMQEEAAAAGFRFSEVLYFFQNHVGIHFVILRFVASRRHTCPWQNPARSYRRDEIVFPKTFHQTPRLFTWPRCFGQVFTLWGQRKDKKKRVELWRTENQGRLAPPPCTQHWGFPTCRH